ncbi:MAG: glycosyltransferase family 2 protein, partial [Gemmataceae bacterium]|nr:glycosyltransferase family 2 protein [Gemmataceae bacterium]
MSVDRDLRWMISDAEGALASPQPDQAALVSIILLCCDQVDYTRVCLESVWRHTPPPYELILVDNGSRDDTPAVLAEAQRRPGPARVEVLRNGSNVGFAKGCNQALAQAHGHYLVFLNNDTLVTAGWLERLQAWVQHDWPTVGLVGPMSNYAPPPQQVEVSYTDWLGLDAFATQRRQHYAAKAIQVPRLSGFCLLARRDLLERIGGFDERYGLGGFEDDDLGWRAQDAGFRLLLALDVFVHHFGSRTFAGLGLDLPAQLQANFQLFRAKWGPERSAGYRLCAAGSSAETQPWTVAAGGGSSAESDPLPIAAEPQPIVGRFDKPSHKRPARSATVTEEDSPRSEANGLTSARPRVSLCLIVKNE